MGLRVVTLNKIISSIRKNLQTETNVSEVPSQRFLTSWSVCPSCLISFVLSGVLHVDHILYVFHVDLSGVLHEEHVFGILHVNPSIAPDLQRKTWLKIQSKRHQKDYAYRIVTKNVAVIYSLKTDPLACNADTLYLCWCDGEQLACSLQARYTNQGLRK